VFVHRGARPQWVLLNLEARVEELRRNAFAVDLRRRELLVHSKAVADPCGPAGDFAQQASAIKSASSLGVM
jgi:hypothetical protein